MPERPPESEPASEPAPIRPRDAVKELPWARDAIDVLALRAEELSSPWEWRVLEKTAVKAASIESSGLSRATAVKIRDAGPVPSGKQVRTFTRSRGGATDT